MVKLENPLQGFDFKTAGHELLMNIRKGFWNADGYFAKEKLIGTDKAFLWPYGGHCEAVASNAELFEGSDEAEEMYLDTLQGILQYQNCRDDGLLAYAAANGGAGDIYYDDNVWLAIIFLDAYYHTADEKWLDLSERVTAFCYSGWDEKLGGGVYWQENNKRSKNTCINAPLAKVSAQLYKATGDEKYLEWSKKLYAWTKEALMDRDDFLYNDNYNLNGNIDKAKYSYNTGCMIGAGAHLYDITGEEQYLTDARKSAQSALNGGFSTLTEDGIYRFKNAEPWFNAWLLDGYLALYPHDPNDQYIISFASAVTHAVLNCKTASGFIPNNWYSAGYPDAEVHLLGQSGTAKVLLEIQRWKEKYHK